MVKLLACLLLVGCQAYVPIVPCIEGKPGTFVGDLYVIEDTCGDMLPNTNLTKEITVEEGSWVTECGRHWVDADIGGFFHYGQWCDEIMDSMLEPSPHGYTGTIYYELFCEDPKYSCRAEIGIDFQRKNE